MSICRLSSVAPGLALLAVLAVMASGCAPKMSERTHAKYALGTPFKYRPAEPAGLYQVKWSATEDGPMYVVEGTKRQVDAGELLGFVIDESGHLLAVAGEARFALPPLPNEARYLFWSTEFVKQDTQPATP